MAVDIREYLQEKKDGKGKVVDFNLKAAGEALTAEVIQQEDRTDRLVEFSESFGAFLADRDQSLTTSQIRNVFGEVKKIEMDWKRDPKTSWLRLQLLRPKLAYTAKKSDRLGGSALREVLSSAILKVEGKAENFQRFVNFFEAILAYHRAAGGK